MRPVSTIIKARDLLSCALASGLAESMSRKVAREILMSYEVLSWVLKQPSGDVSRNFRMLDQTINELNEAEFYEENGQPAPLPKNKKGKRKPKARPVDMSGISRLYIPIRNLRKEQAKNKNGKSNGGSKKR